MTDLSLSPTGPVTFAGFDSAWVDNPKSPGAICSVFFDGAFRNFQPPHLVGFSDALDHLRNLGSEPGPLLLALDQPTIVPNLTSMRPVEKVVASLISWTGGGVQGRVRIFGIDAPEGAQTCRNERVNWDCGRAATRSLERMTRGKTVTCAGRGVDDYGRLLAACKVDGVDVGAALVRQGLVKRIAAPALAGGRR